MLINKEEIPFIEDRKKDKKKSINIESIQRLELLNDLKALVFHDFLDSLKLYLKFFQFYDKLPN